MMKYLKALSWIALGAVLALTIQGVAAQVQNNYILRFPDDWWAIQRDVEIATQSTPVYEIAGDQSLAIGWQRDAETYGFTLDQPFLDEVDALAVAAAPFFEGHWPEVWSAHTRARWLRAYTYGYVFNNRVYGIETTPEMVTNAETIAAIIQQWQ